MGDLHVHIHSARWLRTIFYFTLAIAIVWTLAVVSSLAWNLSEHNKGVIENARLIAKTAFEKDTLYRRWNSNMGGVYVPVTDQVRPNPYLTNNPAQNLTTADNKHYTLMNPAYMTRLVFELQSQSLGVIGHITSLNPLNPNNEADGWETQALQSFENGASEASASVILNGQPVLRFMRPLLVEEKCLKCHAIQGYQVGQVRGGISETVPLQPLQDAGLGDANSLKLGHAGIWAFGMLGIFTGYRGLRKSASQRAQAEQKLLEMSTHDTLTGLFNRSYFEDAFQQIANLKQNPVSILAADVDGLKQVNDRNGHHSGDALLQRAAAVMRSSFRAGDVVARTGGDEFVVILPNTDASQAEIILQRVREHIASDNARFPDKPLVISLGMATTGDNLDLGETARLADRRMYDEKAARKANPN